MRWNHSSTMRHPPDGCRRLWCPSWRQDRSPKASIRPSRPSEDSSMPRTRAPREPRGAHPWATILVWLVLLGLPAWAQAPFPAPQGRVNDFARVLYDFAMHIVR
jgi:hypothetical protein